MNNHSNVDDEADTIVTDHEASGQGAAAVEEGASHDLISTSSREVGSGPQDAEPDTVEAAEELDDLPRKPSRKRPKPGERRLQILQTLAEMLETLRATASPRPPWPAS